MPRSSGKILQKRSKSPSGARLIAAKKRSKIDISCPCMTKPSSQTRPQGGYLRSVNVETSDRKSLLVEEQGQRQLEADIARTPPVRTDPTPSSAGELVMVALPFSSLQLSPALVEYLGLTPTQVRSIQRLMDRERPTTEPLMHELRTISGELDAAIQQSQNNENQGTPQRQRLAATQARLLKQLIRANSHLQRRINDVLEPQQRKKLDSFKRTSEVTVGEGN